MREARARDSGNTLLHKTFPGGHITLTGSNSPAGLASRPIRIVFADEVDHYDASAGTEGDPINLAAKRTITFWNRKLVMMSTPTLKGLSRIESAFELSDARYFEIPCPGSVTSFSNCAGKTSFGTRIRMPRVTPSNIIRAPRNTFVSTAGLVGTIQRDGVRCDVVAGAPASHSRGLPAFI